MMQIKPNEFPQAAERLFLAVVNQAISDVLENGKEAKGAERWLLSEDFDTLDRLFACMGPLSVPSSTPSSAHPIGPVVD